MPRDALRTAPILLGLSLVACGGEQPKVDREPIRFALSAPASPSGVAIDPANQNLIFLVPSLGILETDRTGHTVSTLRFGENGLTEVGYTDLGKLADGSYVLAASGNTFRYLPSTGTLSDYFCLEPGFGGGIGVERQWSDNKAIAIDAANGRIFAAPARYRQADGPVELIRIEHVAYSVAGGTLLGGIDVMKSGILAEGIAWVPQLDNLLAIEGAQLHAFDLQGNLQKSWTLPGVDGASGLAYDPSDDRLWVTSAATRDVVGFPRETLR